MSSIPPLQDYNLDAPEDPPECPDCDTPLDIVVGERVDCAECGYTADSGRAPLEGELGYPY